MIVKKGYYLATENNDGPYAIEPQMQYQINSDRVKEVAEERKQTISSLSRKTSLGKRRDKEDPDKEYQYEESLRSKLRSFQRNMSKGSMRGDTLLAISKVLDCTPYYFMEPSPMGDFLCRLPFWHYEFQFVSIPDTFYKFFLARNMTPEEIASISQEDKEAFEESAWQLVKKYRKQ